MALIQPGMQEKSTSNIAQNTAATSTSNPSSNTDPKIDLKIPSKTDSRIDPTAPAGSENSLGAESIRDGRPATDDSTVEAMDEETPDITAP
jgi:hypothetical protein